MLYSKTADRQLDDNLFKNPTSEYRGAPFWAWNCKLDENVLKEQIHNFKEMGFGGFHMHSRVGMSCKYLSKDFMNMIKVCVNEARDNSMLAWLYDEDKWPSGFAGGYVTKNPKYRQRYIVITPDEIDSMPFDEAIETGGTYYIATYDIVPNSDGTIKTYKRIGKNDAAVGQKRNVYCRTPECTGWFNGYTYTDVLSKDAVEKFIKITHETYKREVGDEFGKTIPSIFTDEPQIQLKGTIKSIFDSNAICMPWTIEFPQLFKTYSDINILDRLPEIFWDLGNNKVSVVRYKYHDFVAELFTQSFMDTYGKWCADNGIIFTGHVVCEDNLWNQTRELGDVMRTYRSFRIPGIDILRNEYSYMAAKQAQSVSHQYGREGVLAEIYGVTNWDFDFRGHKTQGDWEAALGITIRVPHLSWASMAGESKRDYPASFNYQSPWYKDYRYIENHFSRVNTALTRGKPNVRVAVLHPIESYWLYWGPNETTSEKREQLDLEFHSLCEWLLFGTIDFDYISEALLKDNYAGCRDGCFKVGKMNYTTVIVPPMDTIRDTTLNALEEFKKHGGNIIFAGRCPDYVNAVISDRAKVLSDKCRRVNFNKMDILSALSDQRNIKIIDADGKPTDTLLYNMRDDNGCKWLFVAHGKRMYGAEYGFTVYNDIDAPKSENVTIQIKGEFIPVIYNTLTGEKEPADFFYRNGWTCVKYKFYSETSLLLKLENGRGEPAKEFLDVREKHTILLKGTHCYILEEPNVYLLDTAEFALDDGSFEPEEEILRIDSACRQRIGIESKDSMPQPWIFDDEDSGHILTLRFKINSDVEYNGAMLASEDAQKHEFYFNGERIIPQINGYFVDKSIKTFALPVIKKGVNILTVKMQLSIRSNTEWCYILGDFGVKLDGSKKTIVKKRDKIGYAPLCMQDMPFYSGNITYENEIETPECDMIVETSHYRGAAVKVYLDGRDCGYTALAPNTVVIKNVSAGSHVLKLKLLGNRFNTFGALHNTVKSQTWHGPDEWRTTGNEWSYEYQLKDMGILSAPAVTIINK